MAHTGSMIALVPTVEDATRLVVDGGEDADQLHITLMYLGEAAMLPLEVRDSLVTAVERVVSELPTIIGKIFSVNVFSPTPGESIIAAAASGLEPCITWGLEGELLTNAHKLIAPTVRDVFASYMLYPYQQHEPWIPHITAAYIAEDDEVDLAPFTTVLGPVMFDRVRLAFGDEVYDIPLGSQSDVCPCGTQKNNGDSVMVNVDDVITAGGDDTADVITTEKERDVNIPGSGHNLRNYWVRGPGAAKIGWGTDGSFDRCVGFLGKHVKNPEGLCAEYHKQATGEWPAEKGIPSEGDTITASDIIEVFAESESITTAATDPKMPYGDVEYADNGYQDDGVKRYPLDTEEHIRAAWAYINMPKNAEMYNRSDLRRVRARIAAAMRKIGVTVEASLDADLVAAAITGKNVTSDKMDDVYASEILEPEVTPVSSAMWAGVLTVEGVRSGDARVFAPGSLIWDNPSLPLMWQKETSHGGDNNVSVRVGSIDKIWREPASDGDTTKNFIMASGTIDLGSTDGREVFRRMRDGYAGGNSVDVDSVTDSDVELEFPKLDPDSSALNMYVKPSLTTYKCGRIRATTLVEIPAFTEAHLALVNTNSAMMPMSDVEQVSQQITDIVAATNVFEISDAPPREWFSEPTDVKMQGALTITPQGRIYGYVAPADVRHRSFPDRSQYVPTNNVDYSRFMSGEVIVADGGRVTAGRITMNCGHATTRRSLSASQATEHYDNSCSVVARVCVGENKHGVWVAGALLPDVPPATIQRMMACSLSGDWRGHLDRPGWREFVAALLVPVPGFPMARKAPSVRIVDGELVSSCVPVTIALPDDTSNVDDTRQNSIVALTRRVAVARLRSMVAATKGSTYGMQLRKKKSSCSTESKS